MWPDIPEDYRVLFYRRDRAAFGFLSNFHPSPIDLDGLTWATVEHDYQAQKSFRSDYREQVRSAPTPGAAKRLGADPSLPRRSSRRSYFLDNPDALRPDWQEARVAVMRAAVMAKFAQNQDLGGRLLATESAELIEDSRIDAFWGCGQNGDGQNWLGRVLMDVRAALAQAPVRVPAAGPGVGAAGNRHGA